MMDLLAEIGIASIFGFLVMFSVVAFKAGIKDKDDPDDQF